MSVKPLKVSPEPGSGAIYGLTHGTEPRLNPKQSENAAALDNPWPRIRRCEKLLAGLLRLADGTASLTIHLEYRNWTLVKVSPGGKLSGERS